MKLNNTKLISICLMIMILLNIVFFSIKVEAASFSVTASKTSVTVGETFNVTINGAGLIGQYSIAGSNVTINGESTVWIENTSITVSCTANTEGTATVTVTPITVADISGDDIFGLSPQTVNITVTASSSGNTGNTGGGTTSKSTEARLKNLGITPNEYDFSGFSKNINKEDWSVSVPNDVSQVKIYATPLDSKATVSGTGTVTLKEGANSFKITVTAEAGNTKTYTLNITRVSATDNTDDSENEESEARLKNLGIKPEEYDFSGFKRDTTSYSVEVPNEVTEVEVYAEPVSSKAQVTRTGKITLNEGVNKVEVKVTAEDGTEMVYTLEITRIASTTNEEEPETNKELGLSSLNIKNFSLSPKFDPETYEYTLGIRNDIDSLEIEAKANNSNATVEIVGNENLKDGENIITILVSNAETEEYATYQIIVNKNAESEIAGTVDWTNPSTWGLKEKIIVGVAVLLVIVIIVAIIIKIKLAKKEDEDLDLPGAEELDRALAEHQELEDETKGQDEEFIETSENDNQYNDYYTNSVEQEKPKSDIERAQEYFESYTKRKGKHF